MSVPRIDRKAACGTPRLPGVATIGFDFDSQGMLDAREFVGYFAARIYGRQDDLLAELMMTRCRGQVVLTCRCELSSFFAMSSRCAASRKQRSSVPSPNRLSASRSHCWKSDWACN